MKIDHIKSRGSVTIHRGMNLSPGGSPQVTVTEIVPFLRANDNPERPRLPMFGDPMKLLAWGRVVGVYSLDLGDLIVYAADHDGLPEDDHGE